MTRERVPCVYIFTTGFNGTFYVGATSNLVARVAQHRDEVVHGHTKRYEIKRLVYWEIAETMDATMHREKQFKRYPREWKINLIERDNPHWEDLALALGLPSLEKGSAEAWTPALGRGDGGK